MENGIKAFFKRIVDAKIYNKFEQIIFVSKDNLEKFKNAYTIKSDTKVIYNYIDINRIRENAKTEIEQLKQPSLVSVARLVPQKAINRFIDVHSKLVNDGIENYVYIIGEGPEKQKLLNKIKEKKVEDTFILLGKKTNPYPYIKNASYFCLFSEFEGYGMVIEEAKILGKNILITNTAAREACMRLQK